MNQDTFHDLVSVYGDIFAHHNIEDQATQEAFLAYLVWREKDEQFIARLNAESQLQDAYEAAARRKYAPLSMLSLECPVDEAVHAKSDEQCELALDASL